MNEQVIPAHRKIHRSDLFWLAYLVFFFIEPIARNSAMYWLKCLAAVAVFLVLYVSVLRTANLRIRLALLAAMTLLGLACYPWNSGGPTFIIYVAALTPFFISSTGTVFAILVANGLLLATVGYGLHITPYSWFSDILLVFLIGGMNIYTAQESRASCKLRRQQEEIETLAAMAERERIARDLHDVLGHTLSVIVLKSELAGRLIERECETALPQNSPGSSALAELARARAEIRDIEGTARTALAEVREAIGGYRARGLRAEVEAARSTLAAAGVTLLTDGDLKSAGLSAAEETVLALALREAVTNIVRHAQATTCRLRLVARDGTHRLSIEDDGQHAAAREGNGLRGMRERVESLGGQLSLSRDRGTHLLIELPQRAGAAT